MNREIKFRAWDKFNACYYYSEKHTLAEFFSRTIELADADNGIIYQQYTGLKDKNGKEIYEGDIWKYNGKIALVVFTECKFQLKWSENLYGDLFTNVTHDKSSAIIGNIYEHPELITA